MNGIDIDTQRGVISEHTSRIERFTGSGKARKSIGVQEGTYWTWHTSDTCPDIDGDPIVERGVTIIDASRASFACESCACATHTTTTVYPEELTVSYDNLARRAGSKGTPAAVNPPTEAQVRFFTKLVGEKLDVDVDEYVATVLAAKGTTKRAVSNLIDKLVAMPAKAGAPAPTNVRPNRYAGRCGLCGQDVAENFGRIEKRNGRWVTFHLDGACPKVVNVDPDPLPAVPRGHYAIVSTGDNDLAFYRVDQLDDGRTFVKLVVGGHPDRNIPDRNVRGVLARIVEAGIAESAQLYGQQIGRCSRCNRHLTDDESRARGLGPECAKKGGV
jgi:hypothetical protein